MKWHLLSIILALFYAEIDYLQKRKTLVEHGQEVPSDIILQFFESEEKIYEKGLMEFSFFLFFKLSKYEKGLGCHCH